MNTFVKDLNIGQKYEKIALEHIKYDSYEISKGNFKEYDILTYLNGKQITYEVKSDRLAYKSGNICIEYECSNKPSGITTTTSDYYIYFVIEQNKYTCYKIPTIKLKELIKGCRSVKGGDRYKARMYLLPFKTKIFNEFKT